VRDPLAFLLGPSDGSSRHRKRWARDLGSHLLDAVACVALPEVGSEEEEDEEDELMLLALRGRNADADKEA